MKDIKEIIEKREEISADMSETYRDTVNDILADLRSLQTTDTTVKDVLLYEAGLETGRLESTDTKEVMIKYEGALDVVTRSIGFCECGAFVNLGSTFCSNCGKKVKWID